jgi:hypothetical protein
VREVAKQARDQIATDEAGGVTCHCRTCIFARAYLEAAPVIKAAVRMRKRVARVDDKAWDFGRWNECAEFDDALLNLIAVDPAFLAEHEPILDPSHRRDEYGYGEVPPERSASDAEA